MHAIACTLDRAGANAVQVAGRECAVGGFMATASFTAAVEGTACLATLYGRPKSTEHIVNVQERGVPGASLPHTGALTLCPGRRTLTAGPTGPKGALPRRRAHPPRPSTASPGQTAPGGVIPVPRAPEPRSLGQASGPVFPGYFGYFA